MKHFNITVTGKVQGVFFRAHTETEAKKLGLTGFVRNESNGTVYIEAEGEEEQLKELLKWCRSGPIKAVVQEVKFTESALKNYSNFNIKKLF
ncbi:MAG: acylphosphatase [Bacteroidetes bacterium RIFCSPLOWO2_12_FULL_35_15]|nr:MAG: acylphosphatase [Bacteroidetes bacterium RIFCSPLOWO2_12_FULL_35_15]